MNDYNDFFKLIIENMRKLFYPEEWIKIDMSLSKSELFAMLLLDQQGEIIMSQIADYINVPMSTATGIVDRLVKNGYLIRERSESDRRIVTIKLAEKGDTAISEFKAVILRYMQFINEALSDEERQVLFGIMNKVISIINKDNLSAHDSEPAQNKIKKIQID